MLHESGDESATLLTYFFNYRHGNALKTGFSSHVLVVDLEANENHRQISSAN